MKALSVILVIIALLLAAMLWELERINGRLGSSSQDVGSIVASNQALIGSIQKLEGSFDSLRQEIADFREKMLKR